MAATYQREMHAMHQWAFELRCVFKTLILPRGADVNVMYTLQLLLYSTSYTAAASAVPPLEDFVAEAT